jgi:integrase
LGDWVEEWWTTTQNLRPSARRRDRGYLDRYVLPTFADFSLAELRQLDVRAWAADLSSRGLAPATVVKAYQLLGKVMSAAVDGGLIAANPCRRVPLPKVEREEMRFLAPADLAALADVIHPRYRALVLLAGYGGPRIGELAGLRRGRVDVLRAKVDIAEICTESEGHLYFGPPKTKAGRRIVSVPRFLADELGTHLGQWVEPDPKAFVFAAPDGGPLRATSWRARFWRPAVTSGGLQPLRPHDLRHTAVALWIAQGANPKHVAALAGHSSVAFTLDRYGHLFDDADDALMGRLDASHRAVDARLSGSVRSRGGHAGVTPLHRETRNTP